MLDIISSLPTPKRPSTVIDCDSSFDEFILPSLSDISSLLEATHRWSPIDPLPLAILKQVTNPIAILLKSIIHHSLTTDSVPNYMKLATITPILKQSNSNSLSVANYRPISNLSTHSKIRVVAKQLIVYMISNNIPSIFQSTYLQQKSTETALTLISSNLLSKLNNTHGTIPTLLYMSSAINTLDHNTLHNISTIISCIDCPPSKLMALILSW